MERNLIKHKGITAKVNIELLENIILTGLTLFNTANKYCKKIGLAESTLSTIRGNLRESKKNYTPKIAERMNFIIEKSFVLFLDHYSDKVSFNEEYNRFEDIENITSPQFIDNGIYYGIFCNSEDPNSLIYHFIMKFINNEFTIWSKYKESPYSTLSGKYVESGRIFYSVLINNRSRIRNFIIGNTSENQETVKEFIATWNTPDGNICSALCKVYYIKNSPYTNLDIIKNAGYEISKIIRKSLPEDAENILRQRKNKFIVNSF